MIAGLGTWVGRSETQFANQNLNWPQFRGDGGGWSLTQQHISPFFCLRFMFEHQVEPSPGCVSDGYIKRILGCLVNCVTQPWTRLHLAMGIEFLSLLSNCFGLVSLLLGMLSSRLSPGSDPKRISRRFNWTGRASRLHLIPCNRQNGRPLVRRNKKGFLLQKLWLSRINT